MTAPIRPEITVVSPIERGGIPLGASAGSPSFKATLAQIINGVSDLQAGSQDLIAAFVHGEAVDLHEVMAAAEEAAISLELLVELRNKLTEVYRTVMNMHL